MVSLEDFTVTLDAKYAKILRSSLRPSESAYEKASSISNIFSVLFADLQKHDPSSAALLRVCAYFGTWVIEMNLLRTALAELRDKRILLGVESHLQMPQDEFDLQTAVDSLAEMSLVKVKRNHDGYVQEFRLHGLLSTWCVECLDTRIDWGILACAYIATIIRRCTINT